MYFSLIVTTYNRADLLDKCMLSVVNQSTLADEIIFADDGSDKDMLSVIRKYHKLIDKPMKFVTQKDRGFRLSRSRNNAVKEANGNFIFFADQDMLFTKYFFDTVKSNIKENNFIVALPIRLTKNQSSIIKKENIINSDFDSIILDYQKKVISKRYKRDRLYRILNNLHLRKQGSKFRGGVAGFFKKDFINVNGYDENYVGWGNEDDDFGRRLYYSGIKGLNPFINDFPLHLWHKENHDNGLRLNLDYYKQNARVLNKNNYRCKYGYNNTLDNDIYKVIDI